MSEHSPDDQAEVARVLGQRLRAVRGPIIALLLICALGHGASWAMAERYLRPACTAAAAQRHWHSLGYRLPGSKGRRSYCVLQDAEGSEHLISANRLVFFSFLFDPWLMSFLVGLPSLLLLVRRGKRNG